MGTHIISRNNVNNNNNDDDVKTKRSEWKHVYRITCSGLVGLTRAIKIV